jgi:hypothetical protein
MILSPLLNKSVHNRTLFLFNFYGNFLYFSNLLEVVGSWYNNYTSPVTSLDYPFKDLVI